MLVNAGLWEISEYWKLARRDEGRGKEVTRQLSQEDEEDAGAVGMMTRSEEVLTAAAVDGEDSRGCKPQWLPGFLLFQGIPRRPAALLQVVLALQCQLC